MAARVAAESVGAVVDKVIENVTVGRLVSETQAANLPSDVCWNASE